MKLGDRQRHQRIGDHEPDRTEPEHAALAKVAHGPHGDRGERSRGHSDPRQHPVAELAHEIFEGPAIPVAAEDQPPPVVVAIQLVPEGEAVADEHGVVPREGHHGARHDRQYHPGADLGPRQPLPVPGEEQISQEHQHGQTQACQPLGQHGQPTQRGSQQEIQGGLVFEPRRPREATGEPHEIGRHHDDPRDVQGAAAKMDGPPQLGGVHHELRQRCHDEDAHRHQEQGVVRPGQAAPGPARQLLVALIEESQEPERERHRHGADEGHVRHGLASHQEIERRRGEHDGADDPRAPAHESGQAQVHRPDPEDPHQAERQSQGPFGPRAERDRARSTSRHAEQVHEQAHDPERKHRLRPEVVGIERGPGPPQADVVAAHGHLARHLAVMGLPRVRQAVGSRQRHIQDQPEQDHTQAHLEVREPVEDAAARAGRRDRRIH